MHAVLRRPLRVAALLVSASLFACSDSNGPTGPEPAASLDAVLTEASLASISGIAGMGASMMPVPMPSIAPITPSSCSFDGTSQSFVCAPLSSGGLTFNRSYTLYDAAGGTQSQFSPTTTASVRTKARASGTVSGTGSTFTIDMADDGTVSGLLTGKHVLNGTSTSTLTGTVAAGGTSQPMRVTTTTQIADLVLPSGAGKYPGPGTVTADVTSTFGTAPAETMHIVIKFTGTKCVTASITEPGLPALSMTIDLTNPEATGCKP